MIAVYLGIAILVVLLLKLAYRWQFWRIPKKGFACLMLHHINPSMPHNEQYVFTLTPQRLEQLLDILKKNGFTLVSLQDLVHSQQTGASIVSKPVLLTFDDGYADNFTYLFPVLQRRKVPAVIFLITDLIGKDPQYMTWQQVQQMQQSGLVEFGSHTRSHARLRQLSNEEILQELTQSKQIIEEKLGTPCRAFCYPFGSGGLDKRVRPLVFQAGYSFDFSTKQGINPWPWKTKKTILRLFPRGGETLTDFYIQITRGRSRF